MVNLSKNKGFTLLEIILIIVLLGIIAPLFNNAIINSFEVFRAGIYRMNTSQRVEMALRLLASQIRTAENISVVENINLESDEATHSYNSYKKGILTNNTIKLEGTSSDFNLLYNSRNIAENIISVKTENFGDGLKLTIKFRINKELDNPIEAEKSVLVFPNNS